MLRNVCANNIIDMKIAKNSRQMERHFKGIANHWRVDILLAVAKNDGITLDHISDATDCNIKATSEHARRLTQAGLLTKKYIGRNVAHSLSPYGKIFVAFIKTFSHS